MGWLTDWLTVPARLSALEGRPVQSASNKHLELELAAERALRERAEMDLANMKSNAGIEHELSSCSGSGATWDDALMSLSRIRK